VKGFLMRDAFEHHVWATLRLLDTCFALNEEQLATAVPGTYGSIIDTMRHLIGSGSRYLLDITGGAARRIEEHKMTLSELRAAMEADREAWAKLLASDPDPDHVVSEVYGYERDVPIEIRFSQALHHGAEHRSRGRAPEPDLHGAHDGRDRAAVDRPLYVVEATSLGLNVVDSGPVGPRLQGGSTHTATVALSRTGAKDRSLQGMPSTWR